MFSAFFVRRPVFAAVVSIVIVLLGSIALVRLPVSRYPDLAPPTIQVTAFYPGADAQTVSDTVADALEKEINGIEGMSYMTAVCANDGSLSLTVTFESGTDLDTANVLVQNRVAKAEPRLPEEVKRSGVLVKKRSTDTVMYLSLISPGGTYDADFLSNYANLNVRDPLLRVDGVGDVAVFGAGQFSMRVWLQPDLLRARSLTATEVLQAIREQNVQVAAGRVGASPAPPGTAREFVLSAQGRLERVEQFEQIIVRSIPDGPPIRLHDVARVELGADSYTITSHLNGQPSITLGINQIPGSNLMSVAAGVRECLDELSATFPDDVESRVVYTATDVVESSIREVVITLFATLVLVVLTVYFFLQSARATLVPLATIPVSLIGTFAVLLLLGFSLNILTLFGLVLVIGIVVDDAIIVVENATVHIDRGLPPQEAAIEAMKEVSGPVIATTLVLLSVFVPTITLSGISGTMFQQFAVTISVATVFSSINALTLSPALCGLLLRRSTTPRGVFRWFNAGVERSNRFYRQLVRTGVKFAVLIALGYAALSLLAVRGLTDLPTGFVPQEDEGYCVVSIQLPDGATLERTREVMRQVEELTAAVEGTADCLAIAGYSVLDGAAAANSGFCVLTFDPWSERAEAGLHQSALIGKLQAQFATIREGLVFAFPMPSLPGVGISGGFTYMLQDRSGAGLDQLQTVAAAVIETANADPRISGARTSFRASTPQIHIDIDREQLKRAGASLSAVNQTLQTFLGSTYVNDFTLFGRSFKVMAQADSEFRDDPDDVRQLQIRSDDGSMIPLGAVARLRDTVGPQSITRFNMAPAVKILGGAPPGGSSGAAMEAMEEVSAQVVPPSMSYAWSELSYQQSQAGGGGMGLVFIFAIVMAYLVLAAQYESWTLPISVCLSVPLALLGAVLAILLAGMDNNLYTQIGIILLIGLATKTAILLTEFAKVKRDEGLPLAEAAVEAVRLRFRAVMMTALSFLLGVIPLLIASGAGAESRKVLGTTVFGGMLVATLFSLVLVPVLFYAIQWLVERRRPGLTSAATPDSTPADDDG